MCTAMYVDRNKEAYILKKNIWTCLCSIIFLKSQNDVFLEKGTQLTSSDTGITATTEKSSNFQPSNMLDGDTATFYLSREKPEGEPFKIHLDLGETYSVNVIEVTNRVATATLPSAEWACSKTCSKALENTLVEVWQDEQRVRLCGVIAGN